MNRVAAFQAAICTLAVSAISAAVTVFVMATQTGTFDIPRVLAAIGCLGVGSWLVYVGHCRSMLPAPAR